MVFEELLAEFRALGGVAENVRLGRGRSGRGIFVVDPGNPRRVSRDVSEEAEPARLRPPTQTVQPSLYRPV